MAVPSIQKRGCSAMELRTRRARSMENLHLFPFPFDSKQEDWKSAFRADKSEYFLVVVTGAVDVV